MIADKQINAKYDEKTIKKKCCNIFLTFHITHFKFLWKKKYIILSCVFTNFLATFYTMYFNSSN